MTLGCPYFINRGQDLYLSLVFFNDLMLHRIVNLQETRDQVEGLVTVAYGCVCAYANQKDFVIMSLRGTQFILI